MCWSLQNASPGALTPSVCSSAHTGSCWMFVRLCRRKAGLRVNRGQVGSSDNVGLPPSIAKAHRFFSTSNRAADCSLHLQEACILPLSPVLLLPTRALSTHLPPLLGHCCWLSRLAWQCRVTCLIHPTLSYPNGPSKFFFGRWGSAAVLYSSHTSQRCILSQCLDSGLPIGGRWHRLTGGSSRRQQSYVVKCRASKRAEIGKR